MFTCVNLITGKVKIIFINVTRSMGAPNSMTVSYKMCFH
jgi:hypothetical protein